jgi:hypothetical protein
MPFAMSWYETYFKYSPGEKATPRRSFSWEPKICESGIHIFLNVYDAVTYEF